jgi:2-C-methyl-D-erythritol 2,4-cyclodiphosphate synthase
MHRIGFGYDAHQLVEGLPLVLGGVGIAWPKGLKAHSDGDVVIHAIMDAILGAAALGDIGVHFPDSDPRYKGCSSLVLLERVREKARLEGYRVNNVDCTVVAQRPQILPHACEMGQKISEALGVEADRISVKATTTEYMGFTGREEGIACYAICSLERIAQA